MLWVALQEGGHCGEPVVVLVEMSSERLLLTSRVFDEVPLERAVETLVKVIGVGSAKKRRDWGAATVDTMRTTTDTRCCEALEVLGRLGLELGPKVLY